MRSLCNAKSLAAASGWARCAVRDHWRPLAMPAEVHWRPPENEPAQAVDDPKSLAKRPRSPGAAADALVVQSEATRYLPQ